MIANLRRTWVELGAATALLYGLHRVLRLASAGHARLVAYALVAQPVGTGAYRAVRDDPGTTIRLASPNDALVSHFPRPAAINQRRWASGAICHLATVHGAFAGTIWISRGRYDEDEVRCEYVMTDPGRCVWDYDVFVEPRFRLGRTMGRLWKAVDGSLAAEGVQWSFSRISLFNPLSLQVHARLGAQTVGRAVFVVIGPLQLAWLDRRPFVHVSMLEQDRPRIMLPAPAAR